MQIELTDAMVQQLVKEEVKAKVTQFFEEGSAKYLIRDYIDQNIKEELKNLDIRDMISDKANELTTEHVLNKVAERVSMDIAEAYSDKYYY